MEPYFYRNPFSYYPNRYRYSPFRNGYYSQNENNNFNSNNREEKVKANKNENTDDKCETRDKSSNSPIFEIFGIKLFFDDILLICLIFFLYNEGVKDQSLFISLILLLLS